MSSNESKITRPALGSVAKLGDLYDARDDTFCCISILKECAPKSAINTSDSDFSDTKIILSDKYKDKFEKLDVKAELKLSVLCGMLSLEGSGRYLSNEKSSKRAARCTLVHNISTKVETLNIHNDLLKECIALDAFKHEATHVVVRITWGANLMVTAECAIEENEDTTTVEGDLQAQLNQIQFAISGKGGVDCGKGGAEKERQFSLNIHGDVLPEGDLPQNIDEAMELMKKLSNLIKKSNDGKGKPLQYVLLPVDEVKKCFNVHNTKDTTVKKLEDDDVSPFVELFDQILDAKQWLHDLNSDVEKYSLYLSKTTVKEVNGLKYKSDSFASRIRNQLSELVVEIRQGRKEPRELEKLREKYDEDPHSAENVHKKLDQLANISETIDTYKLLVTKHGVIFVPNTATSLHKVMLQHRGKDVYILFSGSEARKENESLWSEHMHLFVSLIPERYPSKQEDQPGSSLEMQSVFLYVDLDILPNLAPQGNQVNVIQHFKNGKCIVPNLHEDYGKRSRLCYVKSHGVNEDLRTIPLKLQCPSSFSGDCEKDVREWTCFVCKTILEVEGDWFSCRCGKTWSQSCSYRCSSKRHGEEFNKLNPDDPALAEQLGFLKQRSLEMRSLQYKLQSLFQWLPYT